MPLAAENADQQPTTPNREQVHTMPDPAGQIL
jgi:hypothetical protein